MRKKIYRLSEGQFDSEPAVISGIPEKIEAECREGEPMEGSFVITSENDIPMRGMIYSTEPYVICPSPAFSGKECKISYKVIHEGFNEGDVISGAFTLIADRLTRVIPFEIRYVAAYPKSSIGEITDLSIFSELCEKHWDEGKSLFFTDGFERMIRRREPDSLSLYLGYRNALPTSDNLERFLVAARVKPRITFEVDESTREYYGVKENQKETVTITRSSWGYTEIRVSSDADFVSVENERLTPDFFLGSSLELSFYIHRNRLHDGINHALITFESAGVKRHIAITASVNEKDAMKHMVSHLDKRRKVSLLRLYQEFRLHRVTTGEWCVGSVELLDALFASFPGEYQYPLMKTHALIVNRQRQDALWLIQDLKQEIEDKRSPEWAYLLYLCTLIEPEEDYVDRLTTEIEGIFRENPDNMYIFWFLTFLRKEYIKDTGRKLAAISQWINDGYDSPLLYIEAYELYCTDPFLLKDFGELSVKILRFAKRKDGFTANICARITQLLPQEKEYDKNVYDIVSYAYEKYPTDELLYAIISYLIASSSFGEKELFWYEEGIKKELKITGIFEAYLLSLPLDHVEPLPRIVLLYFDYQNDLPTERKAFLYANIVSNKKDDPETYEHYIRQIEAFALSEMRNRHIDDNLSILYQDLIDHSVFDEDIADAMSELAFVKKVVCIYPDVRRVIAYEEPFGSPVIAPVRDRVAYLPIVGDSCRIMLETGDGIRLCDERGYYIEELLRTDSCYNRLKELSGEKLRYLVNRLACDADAELSSEETALIPEFLENDGYSEAFKEKLYPKLMRAVSEHGREDLLLSHFMERKSFAGLSQKTITFATELFIMAEEYDKAYETVTHYNASGVSGKLMLRLINERLSSEDTPSDFLVSMSAQLMKQFLSTEETIECLCRYYAGPTPDMVTLWRFSDARLLDTTGLEERILTQMLYTEDVNDTSEPIFLAYLSHNYNAMVVEAYLSLWCHRFILYDAAVPESVFEQIRMLLRRDERTNDTIRLGLLKSLSETDELSDADYRLLDRLLREAIRKNICFSFYREMDERLLVKYHLYDRVFAEYRDKPDMRLMIRYSIDDRPAETEEMLEMYSGIYVHQFMLFLGEKCSCEIFEAGSDKILKTEEYSYQDIIEDSEENRYLLLNRIQSDFLYQNESELIDTMKRYQGLLVTTRNLFGLI